MCVVGEQRIMNHLLVLAAPIKSQLISSLSPHFANWVAQLGIGNLFVSRWFDYKLFKEGKACHFGWPHKKKKYNTLLCGCKLVSGVVYHYKVYTLTIGFLSSPHVVSLKRVTRAAMTGLTQSASWGQHQHQL